MVESNYFKMLSDEEVSQYKFNFCINCLFYECELIEEYECFKENHAQIQKAQVPVSVVEEDLFDDNKDGDIVVQAAGVSVRDNDNNDSVINSEYSCKCTKGTEPSGVDVLSYDQSNLKNGCIMSCRHVYQVECGRKKVTEGIGDHYKIEIDYNGRIKEKIEDRWEPLQPVFISAQTGQGKNYFIENTLIPYVRELNYREKTDYKILILSNRLALKQQIENRIEGNDDLDDGDERIYSYKEVVDVMTYQSILRREGHLKKVHLRYIYVICDEAHFFTSDAMFNPHTQKILQTIVRLFQNAVRIYMSATPYECLEYIIKCEKEEQTRMNSKRSEDQYKRETGTMVFYHFKRDYSYLDVKAYSSISELYGEIIESVNKRNEKWLIFIDDKQKCASVKEQLEKLAENMNMNCPLLAIKDKKKIEKVYAIDTDSKREPIFQEIVKNERLNKDTYVLISTSVLDNGVNLTGIKNIVVSDMTKSKCLQMVGRARVREDNECKIVYMKRFCADEVDKRIKNLMRQQDAYHSYELAYDEFEDACDTGNYSGYQFLNKYYNDKEADWRDAKHWFGRPFIKATTKLYLNEIAKSLMERLIPQYQCILDEMSDEKSKEDKVQDSKCISHMGQKYLEYQLSWFGKKYCEDDDITFADKEKTKNELIAFLKTHAEKRTEFVSEEEMAGFTKKFIEIYDAAFGKSDKNSRQYGAKKMNKMLEEQNIGYEIDGKPQVGPWKVISKDR